MNTAIGLINPKSPENVGYVLRAAANFRVDQVFYTGHRYHMAYQRNPRLLDTARKVSQGMPISETTNIANELTSGMKLVCVEFALNASSLINYQHPEKAMYIFGPEDGTIDQEIIDQADDVVYVPTIGSMNLSASVNVVLYDRLLKSGETFDDLAMVKANRDQNDRVKVK